MSSNNSFFWEIENISSLQNNLNSISFGKTLTIENNVFYLFLIPKLSVPFIGDSVVVCLQSFNPLKNNIDVNCKISIIGQNDQKYFLKESKTFFSIKKKYYPVSGGLFFIERNHLFDPANGLLKGNNLKIHCEVEIPKINQNDLNSVNLNQTHGTETELTKHFNTLLQEGKFSDAVLLVNDKEFRVHKAILAVRSPVFAAMFEHDCEEKRQNRVVITDMSVEVCQQLLSYIYTEKITLGDELALDMFVAADKYQMESLKQICEQSLGSSLKIGTVVNVLLIADMHSAAELKLKCIKFVNENADEVMQTAEWKQLVKTRADIVVELYQNVFAKK